MSLIKEMVKATGKLNIQITGPDGLVKESIYIPNLVVTVGKNYIASRMVGTSSTVMGYMSIGTGTGTPAAGDTTLGTESYRQALSSFTSSTNTLIPTKS